MKLSKLVASRETLKKRSTNDLLSGVDNELSVLEADIAQIETDTEKTVGELAKIRTEVTQLLSAYENTLSKFKDELDYTIEKASPIYYQRSEEIYNESLNDSSLYTADRYLFDSYIKYDTVATEFKQRIELYTDWKHSGLFIRPEKGEFVNAMISNDPLYVVDESKELLLMVKSCWTPEFQSRIRYKYVNDARSPHINSMPNEQIGLAVIYHFFNYKPLDLIKSYLAECWNLLKPGGVLIFTYNNCDLPDAVKQVEHAYQVYTPKSTLLLILEGFGFEILADFDRQPNVSWLEVKKPGTLTSTRGGQALAQIKDSRLDR